MPGKGTHQQTKGTSTEQPDDGTKDFSEPDFHRLKPCPCADAAGTAPAVVSVAVCQRPPRAVPAGHRPYVDDPSPAAAAAGDGSSTYGRCPAGTALGGRWHTATLTT